jgi:hypothetical protein
MKNLLSALLFICCQLTLTAQIDNNDVALRVDAMPYLTRCQAERASTNQKLLACTEDYILNRIQEFLLNTPLTIVNGTSEIHFEVDTLGSVKNFKLLRSFGDSGDKEIQKIIESCGRWVPAQLKNEKVRYRIKMPLNIRITGTKPQEAPLASWQTILCGSRYNFLFTHKELSQIQVNFNENDLKQCDCNNGYKVTNLKVSYKTRNKRGLKKTQSTPTNLVTTSMNNILGSAEPGSIVNLEISIEKEGLSYAIVKKIEISN